MTERQAHPVADIFPMMSELEFSGLVDDIKLNGLQEPIWLHPDGRIIDGRNRYRALVQLGMDTSEASGRCRVYEGPLDQDSLIDFVVSLNLHRRHLDSDQRAMVGAKIAKLKRGRPAENAEISAFSQGDVAEMLKISPDSLQFARKVLDSGDEDLIREAEKGRKEGGLSISAAAAAAKLAAEQRREFLAQAERDRTARVAKQMKRDEAEARQMVARLKEPEPVTEPLVAPSGLYRCIVMDPPWPMQKIEREERPDQGAMLDYPTMPVKCRKPCKTETGEGLRCAVTGWDYACDSIECVVGRMLEESADEDCHIYLWVTHKFLPDGLRLLGDWGFNYQCVMTWRKNVGITPYSWMYDTEHVLFGRRGNLPLEKLGLRLSFEAPVRGHSVKPDVFYERVLAASPGPRLEMFSRRIRDGFTAWGNEVTDAVV